MRLIKKTVGEAARIEDDARTFVTPDEWRESRAADLGVRLTNDTAPEALDAAEVAAWPAIAVEFPKYTDGRGYTLARLLRERLGYAGELRAVGDVLHDQLLYMSRCGFDAFELKAGKDIEGALRAFEAFGVTYQPAVDEPQPLWRRARLSSPNATNPPAAGAARGL